MSILLFYVIFSDFLCLLCELHHLPFIRFAKAVGSWALATTSECNGLVHSVVGKEYRSGSPRLVLDLLGTVAIRIFALFSAKHLKQRMRPEKLLEQLEQPSQTPNTPFNPCESSINFLKPNGNLHNNNFFKTTSHSLDSQKTPLLRASPHSRPRTVAAAAEAAALSRNRPKPATRTRLAFFVWFEGRPSGLGLNKRGFLLP